MNGWTEWGILFALMVGGGVAALAFVTNPLLAIVGIGALVAIRWIVQPAYRTPGEAREELIQRRRSDPPRGM